MGCRNNNNKSIVKASVWHNNNRQLVTLPPDHDKVNLYYGTYVCCSLPLWPQEDDPVQGGEGWAVTAKGCVPSYESVAGNGHNGS